jgi:hypothetical protein
MLSAKYLTVTIARLSIFFDALLNFKAHFSVPYDSILEI